MPASGGACRLWLLLLLAGTASRPPIAASTPLPQPQPHDSDAAEACELGPDSTDEERRAAIEGAMRTILLALGEDPQREGLLKTPARVAKAMLDNTAGYDHLPGRKSIDTIVNGALFNESHREIVIVKDIEIYSMCEHHMLPFFGHAHIGYIPNGTIIGLSKLARIADHFAKRLQVQERLTTQIAQTLENVTSAAGVMVLVSAQHMCMSMRGAKQTEASTTTTSTTGVFASDSQLRSEFLRMVGK